MTADSELTENERLFLKALDAALDRAGRPAPPIFDLPGSVQVVRWEVFDDDYRAIHPPNGLDEGEYLAQRQSIGDALVNRGLVGRGMFGGAAYFWKTGAGDDAPTNNASGHADIVGNGSSPPNNNGLRGPPPPKDDISDFVRKHGVDEARRQIDAAKPEAPRKSNKPTWRDNLIDPQKLCDEQFPEVKFVVPGIIPEGVTILASRPKLGKSWLILQISTAVANGTVTLVASDQPAHGDVLYLALEDTKRRLQRRLRKYFGEERKTWPKRLALFTTWRQLDQGGIEDLREWCKSVERPTLIAIDILRMVRKPKGPKQSDYDADHEACKPLMELTKEFPGLSIVVAHHDRKMDADDVFDTVSGTLGLTGGVDTIAMLKRNAKAVTLHVEGRDLVDGVEKAVSFDRETCRWMILGEAAEVLRSGERSRVLVVLADLPDGLAVSEIQGLAQLRTRGAADMLLSRMAQDGDIYRVGRGRYSRTRPPAAGDMSEKREIGETSGRYGENPAKRHTVPFTTQSNQSNAHSQTDHSVAGTVEFLTWALTPGRRLVQDIEASARAEGLLGERQSIRKPRSFQLAREALGVVVEREGFGPGSKVYWRLPDAAPDPGQEPGLQTNGDAAPEPDQ